MLILLIIYFSASIFAYGQTSSGKTYTMSGITEYTVSDIYDYIEQVTENINIGFPYRQSWISFFPWVPLI